MHVDKVRYKAFIVCGGMCNTPFHFRGRAITARSRVKEWLSDGRGCLSVAAGFPLGSASLTSSWPVHHSLPIPPDVQFSRVRRSDSLLHTPCAGSRSYSMTPLPM